MRNENDDLHNLLNQVSTVTGVISLGDLASNSIKKLARTDNLAKSTDDVVNDANKLLKIVEQKKSEKLAEANSIELAHIENALHQTKKLESYGVDISRVNSAIGKINNVNKGDFLKSIKDNYPELFTSLKGDENFKNLLKRLEEIKDNHDLLKLMNKSDDAFNVWKNTINKYPSIFLNCKIK